MLLVRATALGAAPPSWYYIKQKCEFSKSSLNYLGHMISLEGITADPAKVSAITNMDPPNNISGVLGMINQLAKFLPNAADVTNLLHKLLVKKNSFCWSVEQHKAFAKIRRCCLTITSVILS